MRGMKWFWSAFHSSRYEEWLCLAKKEGWQNSKWTSNMLFHFFKKKRVNKKSCTVIIKELDDSHKIWRSLYSITNMWLHFVLYLVTIHEGNQSIWHSFFKWTKRQKRRPPPAQQHQIPHSPGANKDTGNVRLVDFAFMFT